MISPLVLTLRLDAVSFNRLNAERKEYFPADRNKVPAHVSLFHHLPGEHLDTIRATLQTRCKDMPPFSLLVTGVRSLGRGAAYGVSSSNLLALHAKLSQDFAEWLTAQDRQRYTPHITIQNKVSSEAAAVTLAKLRQSFELFEIAAEGFCLWRYLDGRWELVESFRFSGLNKSLHCVPPRP